MPPCSVTSSSHDVPAPVSTRDTTTAPADAMVKSDAESPVMGSVNSTTAVIAGVWWLSAWPGATVMFGKGLAALAAAANTKRRVAAYVANCRPSALRRRCTHCTILAQYQGLGAAMKPWQKAASTTRRIIRESSEAAMEIPFRIVMSVELNSGGYRMPQYFEFAAPIGQHYWLALLVFQSFCVRLLLWSQVHKRCACTF